MEHSKNKNTRRFNDLEGFQLFSFTQNNQEKLTRLEKEYSFILPTQFRLFLGTFEINEAQKVNLESQKFTNFLSNDIIIKDLLDKDDFIAMNKESLNFESFGGIGLRKLFSIDFIFNSYQSSDFLEDEKLLMFANWGGGDNSLMVGYGEHNYDQIFIGNDWFKKIPFRKLTNSIFDLIPFFKQYIANDRLISEQLYKNWGEDFWRIKDRDYL